MNKTITIYFAGKEIETQAEIEMFSQQERLKRALQTFGICLLVAIICLPVPVLHLVIPPAALLSAPFAALFVYLKVKTLPKLVAGEVTCQHCQTLTKFRFENVKPPLFDSCIACKTGFEVIWPPRSPSPMMGLS
ncbi:MAG: hypothetical protein EOP04_07575 [Proteobacteria bacterium]|nr:MAG: hypothetical protein EOP04_07575 [Pseudomonadota bacterium]